MGLGLSILSMVTGLGFGLFGYIFNVMKEVKDR